MVLSFEGRLANWRAPRRLQSLPAAVHAEAAVNPAPEGSSVLSTVIVVFGALGTITGSVSRGVEHNYIGYTIQLSRQNQYGYRRTLRVQSRSD